MQSVAERTRTAGWLPNQHGAWAMLVVPFAAGAILCLQDDRLPAYVAPMFATWVLSYFAFHAASGLLKAPRSRRGRWVPALAVYGVATLGAGLLTVWEAGTAVLWWLLIFLIPLAVALWLASRRQERHTIGGMLTVLIASTMVLVVRFPDPTSMLPDPAFPEAAILAALVFGYFGGTVLHVKAMIRRRGELAWRNVSIAWHALWTVAGAALTVAGHLDRWWALYFFATTARAWALPTIAARRPVRPLVIGMIEVGFSLTLLVLVAA